MKNISLLGILFLLIVGCSSNENEMKLTGNVKGLKKGTLLLQRFEDTVLVSVDSVLIDGDSNFSFTETVESPELYYLYVRLKDGTLRDDRIAFFAEPGEMTLNTNLKKFGYEAKITGSKNQEKLEEYLKLSQRYTDKNLEMIQQTLFAKQNGKDSLVDDLEQKRDRNLRSSYLATINYAINNKDKEIAPYLALSEIYDANVKFLDTIYVSLEPKIKSSKYGKALKKYISEVKVEK